MDVTGKQVVVVGAARTGVEVARLLVRAGANVLLSDSASPAEMSSVTRRLSGTRIEYEFGGHKSESFTRADLVILSPGVPGDIEPVRAAEEAGVPVVSELEFASRFSTSRILAVSGTNGKTTTTTLLYRMVKEAGITALLAGNNEFPFSGAVMVKPPPELIVLEVSSFQLERVETFCPDVAVLLNVTPDHLERYADLDDYRRTKMRLFAGQHPNATAILNGDDPRMCADADSIRAQKLFFSTEREVENGVFVSDGEIIGHFPAGRRRLARVDDVALAGRHNLANTLAALCACVALGIPEQAQLRKLRGFRGL